MYVKTDFVPKAVDYITAGKIYKATDIGAGLGRIIDDDSETIIISFDVCGHLYGESWQIINTTAPSRDLIEHTTWRDLEEEFGGQFVRLAELECEQKDRLSKEALDSGSQKLGQAFDDPVDMFRRAFDDDPAEAKVNLWRCDAYIRLESDMQDEYDAYKDACNETE